MPAEEARFSPESGMARTGHEQHFPQAFRFPFSCLLVCTSKLVCTLDTPSLPGYHSPQARESEGLIFRLPCLQGLVFSHSPPQRLMDVFSNSVIPRCPHMALKTPNINVENMIICLCGGVVFSWLSRNAGCRKRWSPNFDIFRCAVPTSDYESRVSRWSKKHQSLKAGYKQACLYNKTHVASLNINGKNNDAPLLKNHNQR